MRRLIFILLLAACLTPSAQEIIQLPGTKATLECYTAEGATSAVVVCPGGSYCWLDYKHEGVEVAQWLQSNGISAFVLRYRVAGWWAWATHYRLLFKGMQPQHPLQDASKAIEFLKYSAGMKEIGIMGFSAGGHLAMQAAIGTGRVQWAAAIYPVVSMSDPSTHRRSRRALLGETGQFDELLRDHYSIEKNIPQECPPVFLMACKDDPVVDFHNSLLLDSALTAKEIPHRFILYATGGHGFGVRTDKGTPECHAWKEEFLRWQQSLNTEH